MKKVKCCDLYLTLKNGDFVTIMSNNDFVLKSFNKYGIINYKNILRIKDNILINKIKEYSKNIKKINQYLKEFKLFDYKNKKISELNFNDKIKLCIMMLLLKEEVIIINNILSSLDYNEYRLVIKLLKKYSKKKYIINITNDVNETLFGNKVAIIYNNSLICYGETLSVLNEEKTFKRLGLGLPFIIELNKYLMDYGLINKYYLSDKKLVDVLWK